eukprot:CAMPEP_0198148780 /NCGR_PEP_ID=MMETSP1443-20131203/43256_1 /TAXON_ID=186043 /ORGANISM="Entomoneis sp., Strain CCMP2396" /LENGTH=211 /DNA_ID=CAMNT_0043813579 /DNA_START=204 /DNA_END=835 /DNA_ORIENTATION=+
MDQNNLELNEKCDEDHVSVETSVTEDDPSTITDWTEVFSSPFVSPLSLTSVPTSPKRKIVRFQGARKVLTVGENFADDEGRRCLIRRIDEAMDELKKSEKDLQENVRVHYAKAEARFDNCNQRGAIISMHKVHKLQNEEAAILFTIGELRTLEIEVEAEIWEDWKMAPGKFLKLSRKFSYAGASIPSVKEYERRLEMIMVRLENKDIGLPV